MARKVLAAYGNVPGHSGNGHSVNNEDDVGSLLRRGDTGNAGGYFIAPWANGEAGVAG